MPGNQSGAGQPYGKADFAAAAERGEVMGERGNGQEPTFHGC